MNKPVTFDMKLNSTREIIDDIKAGKMVIIMDDEDRENEGDILMAAEAVTAEHINFMAKYGRGLICLTLSEKRCKQLRLPLMVGDNREVMETNFTVSIEAAEGVTTGISATDRATTVQAAIILLRQIPLPAEAPTAWRANILVTEEPMDSAAIS